MATLVLDPYWEEWIKSNRGDNARDEVWDGLPVMLPLPNNEHHAITGELFIAFKLALVSDASGRVFHGCNVSDRAEGWTENYRIPDVAVFLSDNPAQDLNHHWFGGPDLAVEVLSFQDQGRDKLPFYSKVAVRELLIVDRDPWALELYQAVDGTLTLASRVSVNSPEPIRLVVLPLSLRLIAGKERPSIEVTHTTDGRRWTV